MHADPAALDAPPTALHPRFGARFDGLDLRRLDAAGFARLEAAVLRYGFIAISGQDLTLGELTAFSRLWGPLFRHYVNEYTIDDHPEVMVISNNWENGKRVGAPNNGIFWHSDQIFKREPVSLTILYGRETPSQGGATLFADMRAVADDLDPALFDRLLTLRAMHSFCASYDKNYVEAKPLTAEQRAAAPDIDHPVLRRSRQTGRLSVFLDPDSTTHLIGVPAEESARILQDIYACFDDPRYVHAYQWRQGDVVIWDNRCLMHCATSYDADAERRVMWRTQVVGDLPV